MPNTERPVYVCNLNFLSWRAKRAVFFESSEDLARPNKGSVTECVSQSFDDNHEHPIVRY